jgi:hypothetical protein
MNSVQFSELKGKTIKSIKVSGEMDEVTFACSDGTKYLMYHSQSCCESVYLEKYSMIELDELAGQKIISAYETSESGDREYGSETWTFYNIQGEKSSATLRWYGSSNGYYSESVSFYRTAEPTPLVTEAK